MTRPRTAVALVALVVAAPLQAAGSGVIVESLSEARCVDPLAGTERRVDRWPTSTLAWQARPPVLRVTPRESTPRPDEVVATARAYVGAPYAWGGVGDRGFDCSGFTNKVYADHGYDLPRTAGDQFLVGVAVPMTELEAGDLVFFAPAPGGARVSHVGLYVGDGEFIHASSGKGEVTYDRIDTSYYRSRASGARRILALPPGIYSSADGGALPGDGAEPPLDELVRSAIADDAGLPRSEHAAADRPWQLASFQPLGEATRVGPATLRPLSTALGLRLGAGRLDDSAGLLAVPEVSYFGHDDALAIRVAAPFEAPFAGEPRDRPSARPRWKTPRDFSRIVQEVRFGQKGSDLYVELGRTASLTLGHGSLVRYHTPSLASRSLPDYVLRPGVLSLAADAAFAAGGAETFVDDVTAPAVAGLRLSLRPGFRDPSARPRRGPAVAVTYVADARAPYGPSASGGLERRAVHGVGLDAELTFGGSRGLEVTTYADIAALAHEGGQGAGGTAGGLLRAAFAGRRLHAFRLRVEAKLASATFLPSYFDATYRLDRLRAPGAGTDGTPVTKLRLLETLAGSAPRWGAYVELGYQMQRRVGAGLGYEDGGAMGGLPPPRRYAGRSLFAYLELRDIYLPSSSKSVSLHLAYHRRNFRRLAAPFADGRASEYGFAAASLAVSRYVVLGGSVRRAFDVEAGEGRAVDGVLDVTVRYEL